MYPDDVVAAEIVQQGDFFFDGDGVGGATCHVGQDADLVVLFDGELGDGVEGAEGLDGIVEEFDAEGVFVGIGEDVHYATANGVLSGLYHEVDPFEVVLLEYVHDEIDVGASAFDQPKGVAGQGARGDDFLVECVGIGYDDHRPTGRELFDHFAPLQYVGIVGAEEVATVVVDIGGQRGVGSALAFFAGFAVGRGEEEHTFLVDVEVALLEHDFHVVYQIVGFLFVAGDDQLIAVGVEKSKC